MIKNKRYLPTKKNGGDIPNCDDHRKKWVPVGCGRCIECMNQKKRNWQVRLHEEIKHDNTGKFVTLTFSEESLKILSEEIEETEGNKIAKTAVRRFLERWRKKYKKSIKHWLITEMGHQNTERIHLHGILFTKETEEIEKIWQYGQIYIGEYVNSKTINYIIKYVTKIDTDHKNFAPLILTSPGIGKGYERSADAKKNTFMGEETNDLYRLPNGNKIAMPIYYRNKIYSEDEREKLWTNLLNKNERWVRGTKINISTLKGKKQYHNALLYQQKINKKLGYQDDTWKKENYVASLKMLENNLEH